MMKKIVRTLLFLAISLCIALSVAACGGDDTPKEADFAFLEEYVSNGITLDMYDEFELLPIEGGLDGITITSADPSILEVNGNTLISRKEGQTTITASRNGASITLIVRVYDTGASMLLKADTDIVYIENETDLGFHVLYNDKKYAYDETYQLTVPAEYAEYAEVRDGKLYGKQVGEIKVEAQVSDYKGLRVKGTFTVKVRPASFIDVKDTEVTLHAAKDSKLSYSQIAADVHYNAAKISEPILTYEVIDGNDKVSVTADGTINAIAEGEATVRVKYGASGDEFYTDISITVKPNYVVTNFRSLGSGGQMYQLYTGDDEISGRKDGIYEYSQGNGDLWESRMVISDSAVSVLDNARKGYRYFGYDVYFTGDRIYVGMDGSDCQWCYAVEAEGKSNFARSDYMQIIDLETNAVTNRLVRNKWIRLVYDFDYYVNKCYSYSTTQFFFTTISSTTSYIDNVRWYLDDEYYDHDAAGNIKFTLNDDGTISATNNELVQASTVKKVKNGEVYEYVETDSTYAPAEGEIGGVSGAWKYSPIATTGVFGEWENRLVFSSSSANRNGGSGDSGYNLNGMKNLTEGIAENVGIDVVEESGKYKFVTFDFYVESGNSFRVNLNHDKVGANIKLGTTGTTQVYGGTDLGKHSSWIKIWEKGGDKLAYYVEQGKWYTVSLAYYDNYDPNAYACNVSISGGNGNVYYFNDIKYRTTIDGFAPAEYAGFIPVSGLSMADDTESCGGTIQWGEGDFADAIKYTTTQASDTWEKSRLSFDDVSFEDKRYVASFFKGGYRYIALDLYMDDNVGTVAPYISVTNGKVYATSVKVGETTKAYLYKDGNRVTDEVQANQWYTLMLPVDYPSVQNWCGASMEVQSKTSGTMAATYFKNIRFLNDAPNNVKDVVITFKPEQIGWSDLAGLDGADVKYYPLAAFVAEGKSITWTITDEDGNDTEAATISEAGVISLTRDFCGTKLKITATVEIDGEKYSDTFIVEYLYTLPKPVTSYLASVNGGGEFTYGTEEGETDWMFAKTSLPSSNADWDTGIQFIDVHKANGDAISDFFTHGYKYVKTEVSFSSNSKLSAVTYFGAGWYWKNIIIGETTDAFLYDLNGARITGAVKSDTWYTLYIPVQSTAAWGRVLMLVRSTDGNETIVTFRNVGYDTTERGGTHEQVVITGSTAEINTLVSSERQFGATTDLTVTWSVSDSDIATVDQTGKLTATGTKFGNVTVTAIPTDARYASLAASVDVSVTKAYSLSIMSTATGEIDWTELPTDKSLTLDVDMVGELTPVWSIDTDCADYATVDASSGKVTFLPAGIGQDITVHVTAENPDGGDEITDNITFSLVYPVTQYLGSRYGNGVGGTQTSGGELSHGSAAGETEWIIAKSQIGASNSDWNNGIQFIDIHDLSGTAKSDFFTHSYKYAKVEVNLSSNTKMGVEAYWGSWTSGHYYWKNVIVGETTEAYLYDSNGARVLGNVTANTWYTLYIPLCETAENGTVMMLVRTTDSNVATVKFRNIEYITTAQRGETYEKVVITGASTSNVTYTEGSTTVNLETETLPEIFNGVTWTSSDPATATVDENTGVVTFIKAGSVTITATPKAENYASLAGSVTLTAVEASE